MRNPRHIVLVGPMGAGKSAIGRALAARLGWPAVDVDAEVEAGAGASIAELFAREGEAGFRTREAAALRAALAGPGACVVATGGGAVLDAGNREAMRQGGRVVYLQVAPATQLERVSAQGQRPLLRDGDPAQRLAELQARREPLYVALADLAFDTTGHTPDSAAQALHALLAPGASPA